MIRLQPLERRYLGNLRTWLLDDSIRDRIGTIRAPSDLEHERWFEQVVTDPARYIAVIVDESGEALGVCGLSHIHSTYRSAELWIYIGATHRRGVGKQAVNALLRYAFQTLNLHRIAVRVFGFNTEAHVFFQSCGFVDEGVERDAVYKQGRFHDVWSMSQLASDDPGA